jgi:hypothetical protein
MLGQVDDWPAPLMPTPFCTSATLSGKVGVIRNSPKPHSDDLRQYSTVYAQEHFLNDASAGLTAQISQG